MAGVVPNTEPLPDWLAVYGSEAAEVLALVQEDASLGELLHPRLSYQMATVVQAARQEQVRKVEDVLSRRTRALLLDARAAIGSAPKVGRLCWPKNWAATRLGWRLKWTHSRGAKGYLLPESCRYQSLKSARTSFTPSSDSIFAITTDAVPELILVDKLTVAVPLWNVTDWFAEVVDDFKNARSLARMMASSKSEGIEAWVEDFLTRMFSSSISATSKEDRKRSPTCAERVSGRGGRT